MRACHFDLQCHILYVHSVFILCFVILLLEPARAARLPGTSWEMAGISPPCKQHGDERIDISWIRQVINFFFVIYGLSTHHL